ncbi:MAG: tyrosine-type recombinase/integrase [Methylobacterium sp.]|nr:tyrosine-type recombinase/integrase [Methylobacterium sp.]MCA3653218.1 tyrosine-type recombinase/integrase [Methylobacterium sp.]
MRKLNPKNERIKRDYLAFLTEAKRQSVKTVDQVAAAISAFDAYNRHRDFLLFHIEQAKGFKRHLQELENSETGKPLAIATIHSRLNALKAFFQWLAGRPGFRRISYGDAEYFNLSANDTRIASATREKPAPSLEQIRHVLASMPHGTDIEKRNRALVAFTILTGARDDAIASLAIGNVDLKARMVMQDARTVRTKLRKTFPTYFFPVGDDIEAIVADWLNHLKTVLHFGPDDPLFPKTRVVSVEGAGFTVAGLSREPWSNAQAIRTIFRDAFTAAGLPYFIPHSFRRTLAMIGEKTCKTPEAFKAWSQNLGHEKVLTTFTSYGAVTAHRQAEIIGRMRAKPNLATGDLDAATIQRVLQHVSQNFGAREF